MKVPRAIAAWLLGLALFLTAGMSWAWVETHVIADDIRVDIERSGSAVVDHAITMRIQGGPLRSFDLAAAENDITPLGDSTVISAQTEGLLGIAIPLGITARPDGALRVNIESPRGLSRGIFLFHVRYRKNLLAGDSIRREGAMLRIRFNGPAWQEGLDNARCTFSLPPAPTEPRPPSVDGRKDDRDGPDEDDGGMFISQIKRAQDHDEVELIRPHVARSEAVTWTVRADPRALGEINDPRLRPPAIAASPKAVPSEERAAYAGAAGALVLLFSIATGCKARQVKRHAATIAKPRPLIPIGTPLRTLLAGPVLAAGVALQLNSEDPWRGTLLVLLAMALTWYLPPSWNRQPRGPGRWLPVSDAEAFARSPAPKDAWLDASTPGGLALFVLLLGAAAGVAYAVSRTSAYAAYVVAFDAAVLFPLFGTGRRSELPGHPVLGPGPRLARIASRLRKIPQTRAIAWGRLPLGSQQFDELRLLCTPKLPLRGLAGIEVGLVAAGGIGGSIYLPEVLVRVIEGSPAHEAFLARMPGSRWVRGRRADERVTSLRPRLPTLAMTTGLLIRLLEQATDVAPRVSRIAEGRKGLRKIVGEPRAGLEGRHTKVALEADVAGVQRVAS
jgi:hypothetical protein